MASSASSRRSPRPPRHAPRDAPQERGAARGLAAVAAAYLVRTCPPIMDAGRSKWGVRARAPALPFVLQLLGGLAKGTRASSRCCSVGSGESS